MEEISLSCHKLFSVLGFPVTNTYLLSFVLALGIFSFYSIIFRKAQIIPKKNQNFFEWILESLLNFFGQVAGSKERTKEIFPMAATLFILILSSNLIELTPGIGVFSFLRSPSSDLNFTLALSLLSIFYVNFMAIRKLGPLSHFKKFLNFKSPIYFFVGILEGMGEITRVFSLCFRLFGNLFAGEILLMVTSFLFAYLLPLPFLALEILVGLIQATIFSTLVVIFYVTAVEAHHG